VADNEAMFYLIAAASFVEATTDLYTRNLIDYFADDDEITEWLERTGCPRSCSTASRCAAMSSSPGPISTGTASTQGFLPEFSAAQCAEDGVEPTRTREMASRCIVEMGTASYYRTLSRMTDEPVLTELTQRIAEDEINHYKHFFRYLRKYRKREGQRRIGIVQALWNRLRMIDGADSVSRCATSIMRAILVSRLTSASSANCGAAHAL
jgi:hypothetical protein